MKCTECNKEYDTDTVEIPTPLPDGMCANCGNTLTSEEIQALIESQNNNA
jgi:DNA-directed RNA polymerase subunit RPC12/RpoP